MLTYVFLLFLIKREYIMCVRFYQRQTIYTSLNYYNTKCTNYTIIWCVFFDNETVQVIMSLLTTILSEHNYQFVNILKVLSNLKSLSILSRSDISIYHSQSMLLRFVISISVLLYLSLFCYIYRRFVIFFAVLLYLSLFCYIYRGFVIFIAVLLYLSLFCYIYRRFVTSIAVSLYLLLFCYIYRRFVIFYRHVVIFISVLLYLSLFWYIHRGVVIFIAVLLYLSRFCYFLSPCCYIYLRFVILITVLVYLSLFFYYKYCLCYSHCESKL